MLWICDVYFSDMRNLLQTVTDNMLFKQAHRLVKCINNVGEHLDYRPF